MALKILAQNALDAFSDPKTADEYVALIERLRPDVAILTEAYDANRLQMVDGAVVRLAELGYDVLHGPYDDLDGRRDLHGIVLLIRKSLTSPGKQSRLVRIGARTVAEGWVADPATGQTVHVVGAHLNDRSEAKRQAELDDLLGRVLVPNEPAIIAGDLNAIYSKDVRGLVIGAAQLLGLLTRLRLFPVTEPTSVLHQKKTLGWLGSRCRRLSEITSGKTMRRLETAGFSDGDTLHRPTFPAGRPRVQLDHILASAGMVFAGFEILPKGSSDHLGILAQVSTE